MCNVELLVMISFQHRKALLVVYKLTDFLFISPPRVKVLTPVQGIVVPALGAKTTDYGDDNTSADAVC